MGLPQRGQIGVDFSVMAAFPADKITEVKRIIDRTTATAA
jgi:hypothetical protein